MITTVYRFGMRHDFIKEIQKILGVRQTGFFGNTTLKNVIQFQRENGLIADGIVGNRTLAKMFPFVEEVEFKPLDKNLHFFSKHIPLSILDKIQEKFEHYNVEMNRLNLCYFLAQCSRESGNFTRFDENLHYSASGLMRIFPRYFYSRQRAEQYAGKAIEIGNLVYANKLGNGDVSSGDGFFYRGRGCIQLTGKNNYTLFNQWLNDQNTDNVNILTNPSLVITEYKLDAGFFFFIENNLWAICQRGSTRQNSDRLTKRIVGRSVNTREKQKRHEVFITYYNLSHINNIA